MLAGMIGGMRTEIMHCPKLMLIGFIIDHY